MKICLSMAISHLTNGPTRLPFYCARKAGTEIFLVQISILVHDYEFNARPRSFDHFQYIRTICIFECLAKRSQGGRSFQAPKLALLSMKYELGMYPLAVCAKVEFKNIPINN